MSMRVAGVVTVLVLLFWAAGAWADPWYVPMTENITGGFDHMQALIALPKRFAEPAASLFWAENAPDPIDKLAHQWFQCYNNTVFLSMDGPSIDNYTLVWDLWLPGAPPVGTSFRFQAYLGGVMKDDADLVFLGPNHEDWDVRSGTWIVRKPLHAPEWIIGDADLDSDVDFADYQLLQAGYGVGTTWFEGDFDGDGDVDFKDYQLQQANYGYPHHNPEPATIVLLGLGAGALLFMKKRMRRGQ